MTFTEYIAPPRLKRAMRKRKDKTELIRLFWVLGAVASSIGIMLLAVKYLF